LKQQPLFSIQDLRKSFDLSPRAVLNGVSLTIHAGETVALVGRSGAGKSTLARCVVGLESQESGEILIDGRRFDPRERSRRRLVQMVWQDPVPSLSPYLTVAESIREPLDAFSINQPSWRENRVRELLQYVGLAPELASRRPHQLSGGECQRIVLARALAPDPRLLILDEPLSALDPPTQADIVPVLQSVTREASRAVLLISHDLTAIRKLATRVSLLHEGRVVEDVPSDRFLSDPEHPASREFLAAWPALPFD
jgi:ABC-type dipeptide/oligopeptide/nickel transport system ATPase subunit